MPANPTRKTEVQAYSFEIRRMNSALVRRDPVMLHDPLRTHSRATMVGVILGVIGLLGFLVFGILKPKAKPPAEEGIVIGKESGQIYVKVPQKENQDPSLSQPERLIPTFNLASARLMLMNPNDKEQTAESIKPIEPTVVPDDRLNDYPVGPMQGIPGADVMLPNEKQRINDRWSVCHSFDVKPNLRPSEQEDTLESTQRTAVLAGTNAVDKELDELPSNTAILVQVASGPQQLIYRPAETATRKANIVRATVRQEDSAVREALGLNSEEAVKTATRPMTQGLLNSIDEVGDLTVPDIANDGAETGADLGGRPGKVGEVFQVGQAGGTRYYVILPNGKQQVSEFTADALNLTYGDQKNKTIPAVAADKVDAIKDVPENEELKVDDFPGNTPEMLDPIKYPTTCLEWRAEKDDYRTRIFTAENAPIPYPRVQDGNESRGCGREQTVCPYKVTQPNEIGIKVDEFYMPQHRGAVIRSATGKGTFENGPIQLISDHGKRFGVPDLKTAAHLGLYRGEDSIRPAPEPIIDLLPPGESLNAQNASRVFDGNVPVEPAPKPGAESDESGAAQGQGGG